MLREYLEQVWAAVAKEALTMIFTGADTTGLDEDARLTAMWLWTINAGNSESSKGGNTVDEKSAARTRYLAAAIGTKLDGSTIPSVPNAARTVSAT